MVIAKQDAGRRRAFAVWGWGATLALVAVAGLAPAAVAVPAIDAIAPTSVVEGSAGITLTVTGSGFVAPTIGPTPAPGTVVRFAGLAYPTTFVSAAQLTALIPGADSTLTRIQVAKDTVLGQFSEQGLTAFLNATGGIFCSFADVPCPGSGGGTVTDTTGVTGWRYAEAMFRLGWTSGCQDSGDGQRRFCPSALARPLETPGTFGVVAVTTLLGPVQPQPSNTVNFVVLAATSVDLVSSRNPSVAGHPVTFTATVTGTDPTGTVQFLDGDTPLGAPVPVSEGAVSLTTADLAIGTHPITAVYSGDGLNATGTSPVLEQVVEAVPVPTLSEWGLIGLMVALALLGARTLALGRRPR